MAVKNTPPVIRMFEQNAPTDSGTVAIIGKALTRTAIVGTPLELPLWATDDAKYSSGDNGQLRNPPPAVTLTWSKYRGPGAARLRQGEARVREATRPAKCRSAAKRRRPKRNSASLVTTCCRSRRTTYSGTGGGGEVCCWTTILVKVAVKP